jgi:hypothetical protein
LEQQVAAQLEVAEQGQVVLLPVGLGHLDLYNLEMQSPFPLELMVYPFHQQLDAYYRTLVFHLLFWR